MALTLDATLAAAQDSQSRRLLVEIKSAAKVADVPFDGQFLTQESFNEFSPAAITHGTGRLCLAYVYGPTGGKYGIKYVYTDPTRSEFTTVTIEIGTQPVQSVSLCEMTDGNIGLVCLINDGSNHLFRLTRRIVTITGAAVSNAEIANWSHDTYTSDPWVSTIAENSYLLVYGKKSGSDYYLYKRTSADSITWSAESALSIGDLTSTWRLANPSITRISTGDLWLWFDALEATGPGGEELTNIYYSVSADGGATWGDAVKVTNYAQYSEVGSHPVAVQKVAGTLDAIFTRTIAALKMDASTTGWGHYLFQTDALTFDAVNRKLYVTNIWNNPTAKYFGNITRINVDTWEVDKYWDDTTTPGFPAWLGHDTSGHSCWFQIHKGEGHLIPVMCVDAGHYTAWVLDGEGDSIREYCFQTNADHGTTANVNPITLKGGGISNYSVVGTQMDAANNRLWIAWAREYAGQGWYACGFIDLTDPGPTYDFTVVVDVSGVNGHATAMMSFMGAGGFRVFSADGLVIFSGTSLSTLNNGYLWVHLLSDGSLLKAYTMTTHPSFPRNGIRRCFHYENGKIYGGFEYYADAGQGDFRGLCEIDINTDAITYHRPTWSSIDEYGIVYVWPGEPGQLLVCTGWAAAATDKGVCIYDIADDSWQKFNNTNIPGLTNNGSNEFDVVTYDAANRMVIAGAVARWGGYASNLTMFSVYGFMRQASRKIGTYSGGAWTFGAAAVIVQGYRDYGMAATTDPSTATGLYGFWTSESVSGEKSLKWDREGAPFDLSSYLVGEQATKHSIDGSVYELTFSLSHGHLFDIHNQLSLYSLYLGKGRRITIRWGEKIAGTDYWQNAGTFYVTALEGPAFRRGTYPDIRVTAQDERALWADHQVVATDLYTAQFPEDIIADLLGDLAGLDPGRNSLPAFANRTALTHQWIETPLGEILNQLCNRYGYCFGFTVDDGVTARQITATGAIAHTYTDKKALLEFSPDDRFSDFTNRVTVTGQELIWTDVFYAEERVGIVQGTCGWWGYRNDFEVAYSEDRSRRCRDPRLVVIETATSIGFQLAGNITETISYVDTTNDKYCIVTVGAPDLTPMLVTLLMASFAVHLWDPDPVQVGPSGTGFTIPVGSLIQNILLMAILMILSSVGNFQYEIWGQPMGKVRRSVQSAPPAGDDPEGQVESGMLIEKKFEDPLCYSQGDCNTVANFEIMVARAQRKRVRIEKIAHLQDEIADTIRILHPYSGRNLDIFITDITRRHRKAIPGADDGYFIDEIEGWVVNQS